MAYKLQYFDEVETDISEAKNWYKAQREGLEILFAKAIQQAIENILEHPKLYAIRYRKIRIAHPKVFPYNIHFYIDEASKTVVITAIIHGSRHLRIVKKRK